MGSYLILVLKLDSCWNFKGLGDGGKNLDREILSIYSCCVVVYWLVLSGTVWFGMASASPKNGTLHIFEKYPRCPKKQTLKTIKNRVK